MLVIIIFSMNIIIMSVLLGEVNLRVTNLPSGASTSALQVDSNATLVLLNGKAPSLGTALVVASVPVTMASNQPAMLMTTSSLPLPTGASTSALQVDGNATLVLMNGKSPALGNALMAASVPVTMASNQANLNVTASNTGFDVNNFPKGTVVLWNASVLASGDASAVLSLNLVPYDQITFFGNSSAACVFTVQFSNDNLVWYS